MAPLLPCEGAGAATTCHSHCAHVCRPRMKLPAKCQKCGIQWNVYQGLPGFVARHVRLRMLRSRTKGTRLTATTHVYGPPPLLF
eukprot:3360321-Alexandrium_andersonii.AAC.1